MQAFVNVATSPVLKKTQQGGRPYWEFRAAESAKNEQREATTWYTVRVFQAEDPRFAKGDFVRLIGKLKLDVFTARDGKPTGVLVVMCYEAKRYDKGRTQQARGAQDAKGPDTKAIDEEAAPPSSTGQSVGRGSSTKRQGQAIAVDEPVDDSWIALVT